MLSFFVCNCWATYSRLGEEKEEEVEVKEDAERRNPKILLPFLRLLVVALIVCELDARILLLALVALDLDLLLVNLYREPFHLLMRVLHHLVDVRILLLQLQT